MSQALSHCIEDSSHLRFTRNIIYCSGKSRRVNESRAKQSKNNDRNCGKHTAAKQKEGNLNIKYQERPHRKICKLFPHMLNEDVRIICHPEVSDIFYNAREPIKLGAGLWRCPRNLSPRLPLLRRSLRGLLKFVVLLLELEQS